MNKTGIEYLDFTWNPLVMRCKKVSKGCANCWHLRMCNRLAKNPLIALELQKAYAGESKPILVESRLEKVIRRKKPAWIGVQFMGDLFHEDVSFESINRIYDVMENAQRHTFFVLTKRLSVALEFYEHYSWRKAARWNKNNIYIGTSIENQKQANLRIPQLLQIPGKHWLSVEPMLENIYIENWLSCDCGYQEADYYDPGAWCSGYKNVDFIACGAETGPKARLFKNEWAIDLLGQCRNAGVPFFMKKGEGDTLPVELQVREMPR